VQKFINTNKKYIDFIRLPNDNTSGPTIFWGLNSDIFMRTELNNTNTYQVYLFRRAKEDSPEQYKEFENGFIQIYTNNQ
jgi:hypothetical protein